MKFNAMGGTYWYGNDKANNTKFNSYYPYDDSAHSHSGSLPDTPLVKYSLQNVYFWTGIQADFFPTPRILLSLATEAAPLAYMNSCDEHVKREIIYKNTSLSAFYAVRQSLRIQFNFKNNLSLALNFCGMLTGETVGTTYEKQGNEDSYRKYYDSSGAYSIYLDIGISVKFVL